MKKQFKFLVLLSIFFLSNSAYAFKEGIVLSLRADFLASLTIPQISDSDLKSLGGANKMEGMSGFIMAGEATLGYIFNAKEWFEMEDDSSFSGMSLDFSLGVGQGHSGQISGTKVGGKQVDVFVNVYYTPVITFSVGTKVYLFDGRMTLGTTLGGKMIADPSPTYQMYNSSSLADLTGVGTMIIDEWQKNNMNPFAFSQKFFIEYNQPVVDKMELALRLFFAYNIYSPKHLTLPPSMLAGAVANGFDPKRPVKSFYLNSTEFGLSIALNFKAM